MRWILTRDVLAHPRVEFVRYSWSGATFSHQTWLETLVRGLGCAAVGRRGKQLAAVTTSSMCDAITLTQPSGSPNIPSTRTAARPLIKGQLALAKTGYSGLPITGPSYPKARAKIAGESNSVLLFPCSVFHPTRRRGGSRSAAGEKSTDAGRTITLLAKRVQQ